MYGEEPIPTASLGSGAKSCDECAARARASCKQAWLLRDRVVEAWRGRGSRQACSAHADVFELSDDLDWSTIETNQRSISRVVQKPLRRVVQKKEPAAACCCLQLLQGCTVAHGGGGNQFVPG